MLGVILQSIWASPFKVFKICSMFPSFLLIHGSSSGLHGKGVSTEKKLTLLFLATS